VGSHRRTIDLDDAAIKETVKNALGIGSSTKTVDIALCIPFTAPKIRICTSSRRKLCRWSEQGIVLKILYYAAMRMILIQIEDLVDHALTTNTLQHTSKAFGRQSKKVCVIFFGCFQLEKVHMPSEIDKTRDPILIVHANGLDRPRS
jgi:hypothetical protein